MSDKKSLTDIGHEVAKDLAKDVYQDALHPSFMQVGQALEGVFRFVALPFKFLGMTAEELEAKYKSFISDAINKVPEKKRCLPSPEVAIPLLEHVKFSFGNKTIEQLYANLLAAAMNTDSAPRIHPSFPNLIKQLSPQDALILSLFSRSAFLCTQISVGFESRVLNLKAYNCPEEFGFLDDSNSSLDLLESLGIIKAFSVTFDSYEKYMCPMIAFEINNYLFQYGISFSTPIFSKIATDAKALPAEYSSELADLLSFENVRRFDHLDKGNAILYSRDFLPLELSKENENTIDIFFSYEIKNGSLNLNTADWKLFVQRKAYVLTDLGVSFLKVCMPDDNT